MSFFVRTAGERDIEAIRSLLADTWHATYDDLYGAVKVAELLSTWHSPDMVRRSIQMKSGEFLLADNGSRLGGVGYAAMSETMTKTTILHQLYVHPSCQRQGIGREIFAELETCFPDAEIMRLEVDPRNLAAQSFYAAHGFAEVDRSRSGDGEEILVMEKPLKRGRR